MSTTKKVVATTPDEADWNRCDDCGAALASTYQAVGSAAFSEINARKDGVDYSTTSRSANSSFEESGVAGWAICF